MQDMTIQQLSSPLVLRIEHGPDAGRSFTIEYSGVYVIGRQEGCHLRLSQENRAASRKHAAITVHPGGRIELEDLGSNNGTFKGQDRLSKDSLNAGDRFSVGDNIIVVDQKATQTLHQKLDPEATVYIHPPLKKQKRKASPVRLLTLVLALIFCLGLLAVIITSGDKTPSTPPAGEQRVAAKQPPGKTTADTGQGSAETSSKEPSTSTSEDPAQKTAPEQTDIAAPAPKETSSAESRQPAGTDPRTQTAQQPPSQPRQPETIQDSSEQDISEQANTEGASAEQVTPEQAPDDAQAATANAEQLFQEGMFFYKAGNLPRAVDSWSKAYARNPEHEQARKWLLRAEGELDEAIDKHYRQGLMAEKYMRYDEARHEFTLVVRWGRNPDDERVLDAKKKLREIEEARQ